MFSDNMIVWFIFLFLNTVMTDDSMEKFKLCNNEQCILIQCYFPVLEFVNATRNEIKSFENFIESNHLFISYHLCDDLAVNNLDEVGACIYGVLFKLYQFDANLTIHQRMHVQPAQIQEESIAVVIDMISKILYRIQSIQEVNELKTFIRKSNEEDVVVVHAESLTSKVHLDVSRTILNYGQWFTFVYSIQENMRTKCLYDIYPLNADITLLPKCGMESDIRAILEERIGTQANRINSFSDLTHVNVFERSLSTLFYIHKNSIATLISNKNILIIPVNILNFKTIDIDSHTFLYGPYPFYLFWSAKKQTFQRLGDQPSNELIDALLTNEEEHDLTNIHRMFDDEVRYISDSFTEIEINTNVMFLKTRNDYYRLRQEYPKSAILFTVKWDSTSRLARRTFHRLASRLSNYISMIDIDCFDWTDVCNEEKIFDWPTLMFTENETMMKMYQGSTDENEMALALFRFSVNQPYEIQNGISVESILTRERVTVLARIEHGKEFLLDSYKTLVELFVENEHIFFMFEYSTESSCLIIKQKYGDLSSSFELKTMVYELNEDVNHLRTLINDALRIPLIPFDPMDLIKSTMEIFIAASHSQLVQFLSNKSLPDTPMVWIDTNSPWVLTINQYGHIAYPAVIYIDFSNGNVYVSSTMDNIPTWLQTVPTQSTLPFYQLISGEMNEGPSQKEIDFNKQMLDEQLLNEIRFIHEESEKINEYGIGFDMNGLPVEMEF